jgi:hypothetical protein
MSGLGSVEPREALGAGVPADQRKRAWCRPSCNLPAGNVGATRWVAHGGAAHAGPRRRVMWDHRARWRQGDLPRWNRRCQVRGGMTDDVNPRRSHDDRIDPHPALRAGLSLPGRGVSSLPRNCDVQTVTPSRQATSTPLPRPG